MFTLYSGSGKTWMEMTEQERKIFLIALGIMLAVLVASGIYEYFKNKKNNTDVL